MISVIALVSDDRVWFEAFDQVVRLGDVIALAWAEYKSDRVSKRVGRSVDFGAQTAAASPQTLGIRPPFAMRAPAAC